MINSWMESGWMSQLGFVFLHSWWQFLLAATLVWIMSRMLRTSAAGQYALAASGMAMIALCPIVTWRSLAYAADDADRSWSVTHGGGTWLNESLPYLSAFWMLGVIVCSIRPIIGLLGHLRLAMRPSLDVPDEVATRFYRAATRIGVRRSVKLCVVRENIGPMALGWIRPIVVVPISMVTAMPPNEIEVLLAHELAHVRRFDDWFNTAQVLIETLFFYHPAVWWVSRQVRIAREHCCDDMAAPDRESKCLLGRALLTLEQHRSLPLSLTLSAAEGDLLRRIRRLSVDRTQNPSAQTGPLAACVMIAGILLVTTLNVSPIQRQADAAEPPRATTPAPESLENHAILDDVSTAEDQVPTEKVAVVVTTETLSTPANDETRLLQPWYLTLQECVAMGLSNKANAVSSSLNSKKSENAATSTYRIPVVVNALEEGQSRETFEVRIRNLVRDIEVAYWDLQVAHRIATTRSTARDELQKVAEFVKSNMDSGTATIQELSQAVGQYWNTQRSVNAALHGSNLPDDDPLGVYGRERKLRELIGLSPFDGRLVHPVDEPSNAKAEFNFDDSVKDMLKSSPELRSQLATIRQAEAELRIAKSNLLQDVNAKFLERVLAIDDASQSDNAEEDTNSAVDEDLLKYPMPVGLRRELARIRQSSLILRQRNDCFSDSKRLAVQQLSDALESVESHYRLVQSYEKEIETTKHEVETRIEEFQKGLSPVNVVLQSLQRRTDSQIAYDRAKAEYCKSTNFVAFLSGTLLANNNISLTPR